MEPEGKPRESDCRAHVLSPSVNIKSVLSGVAGVGVGGSGQGVKYDPSVSKKTMVTVGNRTGMSEVHESSYTHEN